MKKTSYVGWGAAGLSALCCLITVLAALHVWYATDLSGPSLTTDQILACLTLVVTLVGLLVAVAAIAIGAAAIFGYAELRTMTFRKTEEQLRKIIDRLQTTGELPEATARVIRESIDIEPEGEPHKRAEAASNPIMGTRVDAGATNTLPKPYPQDDKEKR
jgi:hypothetical protein